MHRPGKYAWAAGGVPGARKQMTVLYANDRVKACLGFVVRDSEGDVSRSEKGCISSNEKLERGQTLTCNAS